MTEKRFVRKGYKIWDTWKDEEVYELCYRYEVDDICRIMNRLINKNELVEENKELKEKLDDILELIELTGMIHLRKAQIKSIINR